MSLVAYGNSDESGDESDISEDNISESKTSIKNVPETKEEIQESSVDKEQIEKSLHHSLENTLPRPTNSHLTLSAEEVTKRLLFSSFTLPKNKFSESTYLTESKKSDAPVTSETSKNSSHNISKKKTVKITLPSLSEFNDDEETKPKKLKPSTKGSGLFSLLPAPKNLVVKETNRKLIPRVVSKDTKLPKTVVPTVRKVAKESSSLINYPDSGEESGGEDTSAIDFFSLTSKETETNVALEHNLVPGLSEELFAHQNTGSLPVVEPRKSNEGETPSCSLPNSSNQNVEEVFGPQLAEGPSTADDGNELQLDEDAIQRLCGRRGRQEISESQIIDVCGESHLPDPKEWLTKQLTEEQETRSHSHRRRDGPTTQQRRKHQITYLAFQAKERELELKNQWAQNRMSRKQTQAKYGF